MVWSQNFNLHLKMGIRTGQFNATGIVCFCDCPVQRFLLLATYQTLFLPPQPDIPVSGQLCRTQEPSGNIVQQAFGNNLGHAGNQCRARNATWPHAAPPWPSKIPKSSPPPTVTASAWLSSMGLREQKMGESFQILLTCWIVECWSQKTWLGLWASQWLWPH